MSQDNIIDQVLSRPWFYEFELPDGRTTECYLPPEAHAVHSTRLAMMRNMILPAFGDRWSTTKAIDLACHEGYFSFELAKRGAQVLGLDARQEHVDDANLIAKALSLSNFTAQQADVHDVSAKHYGKFDLVLMLGLIYHLENPIGAIRVAHQLCNHMCLIETQVAPNLSGPLDWGNYQFVKPMMGSFAIVDETEETHGPEMSTKGICLAPSAEALIWIMEKVGFTHVKLIEPPSDGYEQHIHHKRVMAVGYV